jgi:transposase
MNSKEIFSIALGLQSPWQIQGVELQTSSDNKKSLHIELSFERGSKFKDEKEILCSVHDTQERTWRHLNFFEHECYLHCKVPRITNSEGKVRQVQVPWAREGSGFTLLFEAFAMHLIENEMPVSRAANTVSEYPNRIWTIFNYWIGIAYDEADHSQVEQIGVDETSAKKGHDYVTVAVDLKKRAVIHAVEGKDAATIKAIKDYLIEKGCDTSKIDQISIDLSPAFISGVNEHFPQAQITFDRFHVKKLLNVAMNDVRASERRGHEMLKGHKYTFLKNNENLTSRQRQERNNLITIFPVLGEAYRLKELFDDFWTMDNVNDAAAFLFFWCDLAQESKMQPFIKFANTVKAHWSGIINYIQTGISNGILEGINSKIQLAKKRARGFRDKQNFINMIYFVAGKLKFNYPHYST